MKPTKETNYPIHQLIDQRWSPRAFADKPIASEILGSILEAARWAPSCFNEQPWRFIIATKENTAFYEKVLSCLQEGNAGWARKAPVLMLAIAKTTFAMNGNHNKHAWHDVGLAVGNLSLQATAHGLYLHQMAGIIPDKIKSSFALAEDMEPVSAIALGYLGESESLPDNLKEKELAAQKRKPVADLVLNQDWNQ